MQIFEHFFYKNLHFTTNFSNFVAIYYPRVVDTKRIMTLKVIAYARNGHTDKFGIPRQSREESPIITRIVFEPEYSVQEALRGIEGYSHLWLIWGFSSNVYIASSKHNGSTMEAQWKHNDRELSWSPTVRPPRLGGNTRMGVFATRSPFRPNPIGLSSVKLLGFQQSAVSHQIELLVSGADLMDGTPIYDIKPYLSFSDSHPDALNGFADLHKDYLLKVNWESVAQTKELPEGWMRDAEYILSQDPRPAYQDNPERAYKLEYAGRTVTFHVQSNEVIVTNIELQ